MPPRTSLGFGLARAVERVTRKKSMVATEDSDFTIKKLLGQCRNQGCWQNHHTYDVPSASGFACAPEWQEQCKIPLEKDITAVKSENSDLGRIWSVGGWMRQSDFPEIYTTNNTHQRWEIVQSIMKAFRDARRPLLTPVFQAYISVFADDFTAVFCLPAGEPWKVYWNRDGRP